MTREEFADLVLSCLEELTAFASRLTRNAADADDLVQATYERAFRSWQTLREPRACRAWLFRIARNFYLDRWRATSARPELRLVETGDPLGPEALVAADTVERIEAWDIEAALERLPAEQREAVLLCDLWGFEYGEIARMTDVPVGTVRSRIARARAKLAADLADRAGSRARDRSS